MQAPASTLVPLLVFVPLVIWRLYGRVRRSIGRQPLSKVRPSLAVFGMLAGYYVAYAIGLIRWRFREERTA